MSKHESFEKNRQEAKFCRKCVWHFCLNGRLVGCEYHLCNDHGRGHPGGPGCPKFLRGNPAIRQGMVDPSQCNVRIKLGLDPPPKPKVKPKPKIVDTTAPRPHKPGGNYPPCCYVPEPVKMSRQGADIDMGLFRELLEDRGGLYGISKETGITTGTIARWKKHRRISLPMAERLEQIYGINLISQE